MPIKNPLSTLITGLKKSPQYYILVSWTHQQVMNLDLCHKFPAASFGKAKSAKIFILNCLKLKILHSLTFVNVIVIICPF